MAQALFDEAEYGVQTVDFHDDARFSANGNHLPFNQYAKSIGPAGQYQGQAGDVA